MKYLLFLFPLICKSQPIQIYPVIKTEQGYLISRTEDFAMLDFYAKNGKICLKEKDYTLELLAQVKAAKIASDSNRIQLQKEVWNLKQKNINREAMYQICMTKNKEQEETIFNRDNEIKYNKKEIKTLKWQIKGLKIAIGASIALGTYFILK